MRISNYETENQYGGKRLGIGSESVNKIVNLLSTSLYSDPLTSFLREIVSNAYDSHIEAGVDKPIIVNYENEMLSVRDFGVGISPERMYKIYGMVGVSTKSDTNEQIGGFGIGRLSGLALANEVNVVSFYNGVKYEYLLHKSGEEISFILKKETPTTEDNGVEVSVHCVKQSSTMGWVIENTLSFFPNIVSNIIELKNDGNIEFENFIYSPSTPVMRLLVGGVVPYALSHRVSGNAQRLNHYGIHLKIPIGSVDLTPSREDIIYNERTNRTIEALCENTLFEIKTLIDNDLSEDLSVDNIYKLRRGCYHLDNGLCVARRLLDYFEVSVKVEGQIKTLGGVLGKLWDEEISISTSEGKDFYTGNTNLCELLDKVENLKIIPDRLYKNQKEYLIKTFNEDAYYIRESVLNSLHNNLSPEVRICAKFIDLKVSKVDLPKPIFTQQTTEIYGYLNDSTQKTKINTEPIKPTIVLVGNKRGVMRRAVSYDVVTVSSNKKRDALLKLSENFYTLESYSEKFKDEIAHKIKVRELYGREYWSLKHYFPEHDIIIKFTKILNNTDEAGMLFNKVKGSSKDPVVLEMERIINIAEAYNLHSSRGRELLKKELYGVG